MALFEKLGEVAKSIGDKTNDAIETTKLNSKINSEKAAADAELKKIGVFYYQKYTESGYAESDVLEYCIEAKAHYDAALEAQNEINRIKTENQEEKPTPVTQTVSREVKCSSCGTLNTPGTKFCSECGKKMEE